MKKSLIMLLSCILLLAILLSACSAKISPEKQLEEALTQLFIAPNETYASFIQDTLPTLGLEEMPAEDVQLYIQGEVIGTILEANPDDGAMPDTVLQQCWEAGFYEIHSLCVGLNRELELAKLEITPTEFETLFVFNATAAYSKDGEKAEVPVSGQAGFDASGKLISITFIDGLEELVGALE